MDEDETNDELIGKCSLSLKRVTSKMPSRPKWFTLHAHDPMRSEGQILVSLQLLAIEEVNKDRLTSIIPDMRECILEVHCVGVRKLLPFNMTEVTEPFIQVDIGDRSDHSRVKKTRPSSRPNGANANFLETIELAVRLPEDPLFAPSVNLEIFESGMSTTPLKICSTTVPTATMLPWSQTSSLVQKFDRDDDDFGIVAKKNEQDDLDEQEEDMMAAQNFTLWNEDPQPVYAFTKPKALNIKNKDKRGVRAGSGARTIVDVRDSQLALPADDEDEDEAEAKDTNIFPDELEKHLNDIPFQEFKLFRGSGNRSAVLGTFKGTFRIVELAKRSLYQPINLRQIYAPRALVLRLYVIKGINLTPSSSDGSLDSYLVAQVGQGGEGKYESTKEDFKENTLNPDFYRSIEVTANIPGL
jgi:hypothetical protein